MIWRPSRIWLRWSFALLVPLLLYLYLPLRAAMGAEDLNGSYINHWNGFWHHVLALGYTGFFTENALSHVLSPGEWVQLWLAQFGIVGLGLGTTGVVWAMWRGCNHRLIFGLLAVLVVNLLFAVAYRVGDPEVFMLPAWLTFALFLGVGVAALRQMDSKHRPLVRAVQALLLLLLVIGAGGRGAPVNRGQDWAIHDYAVALAKVDFPREAASSGWRGRSPPYVTCRKRKG